MRRAIALVTCSLCLGILSAQSFAQVEGYKPISTNEVAYQKSGYRVINFNDRALEDQRVTTFTKGPNKYEVVPKDITKRWVHFSSPAEVKDLGGQWTATSTKRVELVLYHVQDDVTVPQPVSKSLTIPVGLYTKPIPEPGVRMEESAKEKNSLR